MPRGATCIAPDRAPTFFDTDHHESERIEPWASEPPRCERLILFLDARGYGVSASPKKASTRRDSFDAQWVQSGSIRQNPCSSCWSLPRRHDPARLARYTM